MITFGEFAAKLTRAAARVTPELTEAVQATLEEAHRLAVDEVIGVGLRGWPPLASSTEEWKETHFFPTDAPLERTGEMRNSVHWEMTGAASGRLAAHGKIVFSEYGTSTEPPRPVLKPVIHIAMRTVGIARMRFVLTRAFED